MFNLGKMASNVLNSIDNVAKENLEEPKISATAIRTKRRIDSNDVNSISSNDDQIMLVENNEIERLNSECLELEGQCESLKREVEEAWSTYKISQERSAAREAELQDELRQLQKAKQTDKQLSIQQFSKYAEELDEAKKQILQLQQERETMSKTQEEILASTKEWRDRENELHVQISELHSNYQSTIQILRDELRGSEFTMDTLRAEHATWMRQSHARQDDLERANAELTAGMADKQRDVQRLQRELERIGKDFASSREVDGFRQRYDELIEQLEEERRKVSNLEGRIRTLDCQYKAQQLIIDDERQRAQESAAQANTVIANLQDTLRSLQLPNRGATTTTTNISSNGVIDNIAGGKSAGTGTSSNVEHFQLQQQVTSLSQQLLQKQGVVQGLQAERAALKSRLQDSLQKCEQLEQQLKIEDEDSGDEDVEDPEPRHHQGNHLLRRPSRRRGSGSSSNNIHRGHKAINDLEKIGVRTNARVAKAVDMIDTWTLLTGRFLRSYPLLRLGFVAYLLGLHLWVLIILVIHTHSLDELGGGSEKMMSSRTS